MTVNLALSGTDGGNPSPSPAISTSNLSKRYGKRDALQGLTMSVPPGQVFAFLGPNGAGKTTAIKLLLGLARPTSGEGTLLGRPLGHRSGRRSVGYLPELFRYQAWMRAHEVLRLHCRLGGLERAGWTEEIDRVVDTVGLRTRAGDRVGTFSKGMQQRLGLGVALLGQPQLVLLDEPTSALDPLGRHDVRQITSTLSEQGTTVFLNSHLLSEVERVSHQVAIVDSGKVIATGSLQELLEGKLGVRIRVRNLSDALAQSVAHFGSVSSEGDWLTVAGVEEDHIPDVVATLAAAGAQIQEVGAIHHDLEEKFLELIAAAHQ